ncbi:MAG: hypothetical protein ACRDX9_01895 [Acidimicrobiia bacterium]
MPDEPLDIGDDEGVPADLVELYEVMEWENAVADSEDHELPHPAIGVPPPPDPGVEGSSPFVSRAGWGGRTPTCHPTNFRLEALTIHYSGPSPWTGVDRSSVARFLATALHSRCASIWRSYEAFHMDTRGGCCIFYHCVDEETEILTEDGWRRREALTVGDMVLTLNHETGLSEWQPVLALNVYPAPAEMILMRTDRHSSLTTPNHRWATERLRRRGPSRPFVGVDRLFVTTESFGYWDRVPVAADCADLPTVAKHDDALVELVAWFWTEGTIHRGGTARNVSIAQSYAAIDRCDRIRSTLRRCFGPPVSAMPTRGNRTDGVPRWREYRGGHLAQFWLSADAGDIVQHLAPGRVPTTHFLRSLTRSQLALFIETSMLGDNSGHDTLAQKDRAAAEAFQFAVILAGFGSSLHPRRPAVSTPDRPLMWETRIRKQRHFEPRRIQPIVVAGTGVVWCPTTSNRTWLARREGTVYFTGNSAGCPHGVRFEGRPHTMRSGAQGTNVGNFRSFGVQTLMGLGDPLTDASKLALLDEEQRLGVPFRWGHRDWKSTSCPGDPAYDWRHAGFPSPNTEDPFMALSDAQQEDLYKRVRELCVANVPFYQDAQASDARFQVQQLLKRVLPAPVNVDQLAAAIVAALPEGDIDQATVEAGVRAVLGSLDEPAA